MELLFDCGYVDLGISGSFQDLKEYMVQESHAPLLEKEDILDIRAYYKDTIEIFDGPGEPADYSEPSLSPVRNSPKIGRNDPCPCRSGKKYKACCLDS
jgi:preprotein translocase subunit SecA